MIADDHSMIRKGIKLLLQAHLKVREVKEVASCNALMSELLKKNYTHLILDLILSDGVSLEVIPNILGLYPDLKIMVFSMLNADVYGEALKQYNIHYYLQKTTKEEDTILFLNNFLNNEEYVPEHVVSEGHNPFITLTARELEILHYVVSGHGTKHIAASLNLRMNTVSTIKNRIFEKTETTNLKDLMELATLYNVS